MYRMFFFLQKFAKYGSDLDLDPDSDQASFLGRIRNNS
jgi:hypothetical protein